MCVCVKVTGNHKKTQEFSRVQLLQDMSGEHRGAVWTMKFSHCGRFLATAGQDTIVRVWVVCGSDHVLDEMRRTFTATRGNTNATTAGGVSAGDAQSAEKGMQLYSSSEFL